MSLPDGQASRRAGDAFTLNFPGKFEMKFAWCPPGSFLMGSPDSEADRRDYEQQHEVRLTKGFYAGIFEVTNEQWNAVMGANTNTMRYSHEANLPVAQKSWNRAQEFCKRLTQRVNMKFTVRLPTEAEWEYACRADEGGVFGKGSGEEALKQVGWYLANSNLRKQPVGQKKPNKWGLFDMHGNVYEWCEDWFDAGYYARSPKDDPVCREGEQKERILRGGSWDEDAQCCRAAHRYHLPPGDHGSFFGHFGFRVVFNLD